MKHRALVCVAALLLLATPAFAGFGSRGGGGMGGGGGSRSGFGSGSGSHPFGGGGGFGSGGSRASGGNLGSSGGFGSDTRAPAPPSSGFGSNSGTTTTSNGAPSDAKPAGGGFFGGFGSKSTVPAQIPRSVQPAESSQSSRTVVNNHYHDGGGYGWYNPYEYWYMWHQPTIVVNNGDGAYGGYGGAGYNNGIVYTPHPFLSFFMWMGFLCAVCAIIYYFMKE